MEFSLLEVGPDTKNPARGEVMNGRFIFRLITDGDLPMLVEWLTRTHVAEVCYERTSS